MKKSSGKRSRKRGIMPVTLMPAPIAPISPRAFNSGQRREAAASVELVEVAPDARPRRGSRRRGRGSAARRRSGCRAAAGCPRTSAARRPGCSRSAARTAARRPSGRLDRRRRRAAAEDAPDLGAEQLNSSRGLLRRTAPTPVLALGPRRTRARCRSSRSRPPRPPRSSRSAWASLTLRGCRRASRCRSRAGSPAGRSARPGASRKRRSSRER